MDDSLVVVSVSRRCSEMQGLGPRAFGQFRCGPYNQHSSRDKVVPYSHSAFSFRKCSLFGTLTIARNSLSVTLALEIPFFLASSA